MTTPMASAPKQLETKWTAGPWAARKYVGNDDNWYVRGLNEERVCGQGAGMVSEHDARLIAAAPEMAKLIADIEESLTADGTYRLLREACQQMLAKIGGDV